MEGFINFSQLHPTCRNYSNLVLSRLIPLELSPSSLWTRHPGRAPTPSTLFASAHLQVDALPYDERPLPITRKQLGEASTEPEVKDTDSSDVQRRGVSGEPEPLTEKALREASSAIDILGEALVKMKNQVMHVYGMQVCRYMRTQSTPA